MLLKCEVRGDHICDPLHPHFNNTASSLFFCLYLPARERSSMLLKWEVLGNILVCDTKIYFQPRFGSYFVLFCCTVFLLFLFLLN